jgi:hypothetical protein
MAPPLGLARGPGGSTRPPRTKMPGWVDIFWVFFSLPRAVARVFMAPD